MNRITFWVRAKDLTFWGRTRYLAGQLLCLLFFLLPLGYLLFSLLLFHFLTANSYAGLLDWYGRMFPGAFDKDTISAQCFAPALYKWLSVHKGVGMSLLVGASVLYLVFSQWIWKFCAQLVRELKKVLALLGGGLRGCSHMEKVFFGLLMGTVLVYRLYFYFSYILSTDELCSYLYFVKPGFLLSVTSYPIPNNHVFFNACCSLWNLVPGLSPRAVMRLPSMAGDLLMLYGIFCLVRRWDGYGRAIISVAGVAFVHLSSYYAVQGRGYQWQEICVLVSALSCWACFRKGGQGKRWGYALFITSSVVGFYINPAFLYHFTALGLACLFYARKEKDYASVLFLARCGGMIVGLLFVFYLPLLLSSSWESLTANTYVLGLGYKWLFAHFDKFAYSLEDMTNYGRPGLLLVLGCGMAVSVAYGKKLIRGIFYDSMAVYLVALTVSLVFWILDKQRYPPERALSFLPLVLSLVFVNACYDLGSLFLKRKKLYGWIAVFLLLKIGGSLHGVYEEISRGNARPKDLTIVENDIVALDKLHPTSWQIVNSDDYYPMYLREYLILKGRDQAVLFNRTKALADVIFWTDKYPLSSPLEGYVLWGDKKITAYGRVMRIYVLKGLVGVPDAHLFKPSLVDQSQLAR